MRLSFSTRGWAHLDWNEWLEAAASTGFEGVKYIIFQSFLLL